MANFPPPYAPREHAQVQPVSQNVPLEPVEVMEFAESSSTTLEWRLTGMKGMYDTTKGEGKSKCVKSAVFGDADNLWEVLWYANSGTQGGDYASLYLSCVPTIAERDQAISGKWTRKGTWWFRFEVKSLTPDERTGKILTLASKDAENHTFAVKTANWGWQQFVKRDALFFHPSVMDTDGILVVCTIKAQAQPPAGYWLGIGSPSQTDVSALTHVQGKYVGSGGGLSAWSGGYGAGGGVAGGVGAGGGQRRVVPKDIMLAVGQMLDDPLYSDVEFVFPKRAGDSGPRRIYANKKLLMRFEYFEAMFQGGFGEAEGDLQGSEHLDDIDTLSDSDMEDERDVDEPTPRSGLNLTTTTSRASEPLEPPRAPSPPSSSRRSFENQEDGSTNDEESEAEPEHHETNPESGSGQVEEAKGEHPTPSVVATPLVRPADIDDGIPIGPRKIRIVIRDAALRTWMAILFYIYTDTIIFAPLSSSFITSSSGHPGHGRTGSTASFHTAMGDGPLRRDWIRQWLEDRGGSEHSANGLRPVSAKAVYRLADKLDMPALKLRAFQHICANLAAHNIPAEVFSRFSSTYEDVRKVQVAFFLRHWSEIKKSDTMTQIWQQIRLGKHVGFEEVWPLIVSQLEFKQA